MRRRVDSLPLECVRVYNTPPPERRDSMKLKEAATYVCVAAFFVSMGFVTK
jgi:hypothetical protein